MNRRSRIRSLLVLATLAGTYGCDANSGDVGAVSETGSTTGSTGEDISGTTVDLTGSDTEPTGESGSVPSDCAPGDVYGCCGDADVDGVPLESDIDPSVPNTAQLDTDEDGLADEIDLCPLVADPSGTNTQDSDNDGIGNACDLCPSTPDTYNSVITSGAMPDYMQVRGLPTNGDIDGDGVGDACDNCPGIPNCYGLGTSETFDGSIPEIDGVDCQADADADGIGDACDPDLGKDPTIGFGDQDDFDQDGLSNITDACPRLPLDVGMRRTCEPDGCPDGQACTADGFCNHIDSDGDGVGDRCDTCAFVANPAQASAGGEAEDDPDGDGVGSLCELGADQECGERKNPARVAYHPVAVGGSCCTTELVLRPNGGVARTAECTESATGDCTDLLAPHPLEPGVFIPVKLPDSCSAAQQEEFECVALPAVLVAQAGVIELPPGCIPALGDAGLSAMENILATGEDSDAPWLQTCRRPQQDFDFDGLGNVCDVCPHAWDPSNAPYIDADGQLWPNDGARCNGDYSPC